MNEVDLSVIITRRALNNEVNLCPVDFCPDLSMFRVHAAAFLSLAQCVRYSKAGQNSWF